MNTISDAALAEKVRQFAWDYLQTEDDVIRIQDHLLKAIIGQKGDYPWAQMTMDLLSLIRSGRE